MKTTEENKKIAKKYFNKYFKQNYFNEEDHEFQTLLKILNKKDKEANEKLNTVLQEVEERTRKHKHIILQREENFHPMREYNKGLEAAANIISFFKTKE